MALLEKSIFHHNNKFAMHLMFNLRSNYNSIAPDQVSLSEDADEIKAFLDQTLAINDYRVFSFISLEVLYYQHQVLLEHPTNPMLPDTFLAATFCHSTETLNYIAERYEPDQEKINKQAALIKIALDKGANINLFIQFTSFTILNNHFYLFLNHPTNAVDPKKLYIATVNLIRKGSDSNQGKFDLDQVKIVVELLEKSIKAFPDNSGNVTIFENMLLEFLVKIDQPVLIKYLLENYSYDVNSVNNLGQTPLFFARSVDVAKELINNQADIRITDKTGKDWISNPSLDLIKYVIAHNYLSKEAAVREGKSHFIKGNFDSAAKLSQIGFDYNIKPVDQVTDAIITGLGSSIEKNKYQAILNLFNKAKITIPAEYQYLLNSYSDEHQRGEFEFIYGLIHKIADHYVNLAKFDLKEELIGCSDDKFASYYQIAGKALNTLDNDFALEVLTINGLRPDQIGCDLTVYRGMKVNLLPEDIDSYFKFGHRAFSTGENQKFLGFYVNKPWNDLKGKWEYGGTYTSLDAIWGAKFSFGITAPDTKNEKGVMFEINIPGAANKICGLHTAEYELIFGTIEAKNIVAIYRLNNLKDGNNEQYFVSEVYRNTYLFKQIEPHYKVNDEIVSNGDALKTYHEICPNISNADIPLVNNLALNFYQNYTDFTQRYSAYDYAKDQAKLFDDYFADRAPYQEALSYGLSGECDLKFECCA